MTWEQEIDEVCNYVLGEPHKGKYVIYALFDLFVFHMSEKHFYALTLLQLFPD